MDDGRVGQLVRALRRRRCWRQADLARKAGVSQPTISRLEAGHLEGLAFGTVRAVLAAVEARATVDVHWCGGQGERLIDERHAGLGVAAALRLQGCHWDVLPEVTFQRYGERGSVDLLGYRADLRAVCIVELKSAVYSYEETQRRLDVKVRLAADIARERLGWAPLVVGVILIVEDTSANRRRLKSIEPLIRAGLPTAGRGVMRWLADPVGAMRGLLFLAPIHRGNVRRGAGGSSAVRVPTGGSSAARTRSSRAKGRAWRR
jgi:transcriptional regulator with XRE-family HTH domain